MMAMDGEPPLSLPDPAQLEPVDGWRVTGKHGHMAFSVGKEGRLVSLADLVQWLIDAQEMPCSMAVEHVCDKLQDPRAASWLYLAKRGKLAQPLAVDDDFSYLPFVTSEKRPSDPKDCGIAGALAYMRDLWGASASPSECKYMGAHTLDPLAIRMDVAHALWGWGSAGAVDAVAPPPLSLVPTVPSPAPAGKLPQKSRAPEWTGEALARKRKELKLADPKSRNHTQQLAELTGLTPREITRREKDARDSAAPAKHAALRTSSKAA